MNFSRPASPVIAQYYNFLRLGREGYARIMENLKTVSDYLAGKIEATGVFVVLGSREALPLVPFTVRDDAGFTVFELSDKLREFGWFLPAYTMPKNATDVAVMRIVVRENLSRDLADSLLADLGRAIAELRGAGAARHHGKPGHKSKRPC